MFDPRQYHRNNETIAHNEPDCPEEYEDEEDRWDTTDDDVDEALLND